LIRPFRIERKALHSVICLLNRQELTMQISKFIKQFAHDEEGVTAIEYGLIAALIAVVIIASVKLVGSNLATTFGAIAAAL
jgi:pilus assembly protein Flp/PilA